METFAKQGVELYLDNFPFRKKQNLIASEVPLVLFKTVYEEEGWHWDSKALRQVISQLQAFWMQQAVRYAQAPYFSYIPEKKVNAFKIV